MTESYEVAVVGGGAAGLPAALVLGRARRRTLVIDPGEPRNAPSTHLRGYLGEQVVNAAGRGYRAGAAINEEQLFADLDAGAQV